MKFSRKHIFYLLFIFSFYFINTVKSQTINSITIIPEIPVESDTVTIIIDFTYYGNCEYGMVNTQSYLTGNNINIYSLYCGYLDTTICNSVDTIFSEILSSGIYQIHLDIHQGSVCPISGFDELIAVIDTMVSVQALTINNLTEEIEFDIYPIPSNGIVRFNPGLKNKDILSINLIDIYGRTMNVTISDEMTDISKLSSGIYFLRIVYNDNSVVLRKIIKS